MNRPATGRILDAGLQLLDRQLIDSNGYLAGKVDDLELTPSEDDPKVLYATAILAGPGALAGRLGGRLGHVLERVSNRLRDDAEDRPAQVSFGVVKRIENAVELTVPKEDLVTDRLEQWTRTTIIAKLPGGGDAAQ